MIPDLKVCRVPVLGLTTFKDDYVYDFVIIFCGYAFITGLKTILLTGYTDVFSNNFAYWELFLTITYGLKSLYFIPIFAAFSVALANDFLDDENYKFLVVFDWVSRTR